MLYCCTTFQNAAANPTGVSFIAEARKLSTLSIFRMVAGIQLTYKDASKL